MDNKKILYPKPIGSSVLAGLIVGAAMTGIIENGGWVWLPVGAAAGLAFGYFITSKTSYFYIFSSTQSFINFKKNNI